MGGRIRVRMDGDARIGVDVLPDAAVFVEVGGRLEGRRGAGVVAPDDVAGGVLLLERRGAVARGHDVILAARGDTARDGRSDLQRSGKRRVSTRLTGKR